MISNPQTSSTRLRLIGALLNYIAIVESLGLCPLKLLQASHLSANRVTYGNAIKKRQIIKGEEIKKL